MRRGVVALAVVPLVLAACGGGKSSTPPASNLSPAAYVKSSAAKTVDAGSAHMKLIAVATAAGQQVSLTGAGDFDTKNRTGSMHIDFSLAGASSTIDEVIHGTDLYLKSPLFSTLLANGKTWVKLDLKKAAASQGGDLSALLTQDPAQSLQALQSLRGATKIGTEQLGGVSTTHYRARIDPAKLKAAGVTSTGPGAYDVWIGDDGYVRRVKTALGIAQGSQKAAVTATVDLSGFGDKVTVTIPPAAQTLDSTTIPGLGG